MSGRRQSYRDWFIGLEKRLFLVDGSGALVSALLLGGLLARYPEAVGMARGLLLPLAGLAAVFAVYSFSCYRWAGERWRRFLRGIALFNIAYCVLTLTLMCVAHETLRPAGLIYFLAEITVILGLAGVELVVSGSEPEA
jgi:hypothetical protein